MVKMHDGLAGPMLRGAILALLVVGLSAGMSSLAAADSVTPVVWSEPRVVDTDVVVGAGETLIIRGARIVFEGGSLTVEKGGRLVVESTDAAAALLGTENKSWNATIKGAAELRGKPAMKVVITGTGERVFSDAVVVLGGFRIEGGTLEAQHTLFGTYGSGLALYEGAVANLSDVTFASKHGRAIVNSGSSIHVRDAKFIGPGAGVFVTVSDEAEFVNASFDGMETALTARASRVTLTNASFTRVGTCIAAIGDAQLVSSDVSCENFRSNGLTASPLPSGRGAGSPKVEIANAAFASDQDFAVGIEIKGDTELALENVVMGPLRGHGIATADNAFPALVDADFSEVEGFALVVVQPAILPDIEIPARTKPGQAGWMRIMNRSLVQVEDSDGHLVPHANVKVINATGETVIETEADDNGLTNKFLVETLAVGGDGSTRWETYDVVVDEVPGFERYVGKLPTHGFALIVKLKPVQGAAAVASTPGIPLLAVLVVLGMVAWHTRR